MLYMELYVYDYLKKQGHAHNGYLEKIELWGENRNGNFYINSLRLPGESKPFHKPHMQYLGDFAEITDTKMGKYELAYLRKEELRKQKMLLYAARETENMEHFLIRHGNRNGYFSSGPGSLRAAEINSENRGLFPQMALYMILIFLLANMIESLCSYENMQDVLKVVELLAK